MARFRGNGEWRWYFRSHERWWKWPLIGATVGVWLVAVVMFIPWQSSASIDNVQTLPATTERSDDAEPVETFDPTTTSAATDTTEVGADAEIPATSIDAVAEADVVQSLTPEPPTSVEGEAEVTETTETRRRRPTRTDRTVEPAPPPPPILNPTAGPVGDAIFRPAPATPTTTVRPTTPTTTVGPTTATTTVRPTTTTTTVRPTTTTDPPPPTTDPPPPPTTDPPPPPTTDPPPPTTDPPLPTTDPPPPTTDPPPPPLDVPFLIAL